MNKEEKEAIEILQGFCTDDCINNDIARTIVNLIKKQQKEIEKYHKLKQDIVKVNKRIYDVDIIEDMCRELANSISKDKIKEKIEEYNKKCDECNFQNTGICKEFKAHYNCSIQSVLELLKELIGETK